MFNLFNDGDHSKIRQSIFVLSLTTILIVKYELEIVLPSSLFNSNIEGNTIGPRTVLPALWLAITYLILRYGAIQRSLYLRFNSGLGRETDVEQKAKHYSEQIENLLITLKSEPFSPNNTPVFSIAAELSAFIKAHDLREDCLTDFFTQMGDVSLREQLQQKSMEEANEPYLTAIACLRREEKSARDLTEALAPVNRTLNQYRKLAELPELAHYQRQRTAEISSGQWDGIDKFWIANIGILIIVTFALYQTYSLYFC